MPGLPAMSATAACHRLRYWGNEEPWHNVAGAAHPGIHKVCNDTCTVCQLGFFFLWDRSDLDNIRTV